MRGKAARSEKLNNCWENLPERRRRATVWRRSMEWVYSVICVMVLFALATREVRF